MDGIDHLVVGAGTAGCVLAARLSQDPAKRVVLVEAGPDFPDQASLPESLLTGSGAGFDAGLTGTVCGGRRGGIARGRVVGGSSQRVVLVRSEAAVRPQHLLPAPFRQTEPGPRVEVGGQRAQRTAAVDLPGFR